MKNAGKVSLQIAFALLATLGSAKSRAQSVISWNVEYGDTSKRNGGSLDKSLQSIELPDVLSLFEYTPGSTLSEETLNRLKEHYPHQKFVPNSPQDPNVGFLILTKRAPDDLQISSGALNWAKDENDEKQYADWITQNGPQAKPYIRLSFQDSKGNMRHFVFVHLAMPWEIQIKKTTESLHENFPTPEFLDNPCTLGPVFDGFRSLMAKATTFCKINYSKDNPNFVQLENLLKTVNNDKGIDAKRDSVIVMGDFNSFKGKYGLFSGQSVKFMGSHGYSDQRNDNTPSFPGEEAKHLGKPAVNIDLTFARSPSNTKLESKVEVLELKGSDHKPIRAEFGELRDSSPSGDDEKLKEILLKLEGSF